MQSYDKRFKHKEAEIKDKLEHGLTVIEAMQEYGGSLTAWERYAVRLTGNPDIVRDNSSKPHTPEGVAALIVSKIIDELVRLKRENEELHEMLRQREMKLQSQSLQTRLTLNRLAEVLEE